MCKREDIHKVYLLFNYHKIDLRKKNKKRKFKHAIILYFRPSTEIYLITKILLNIFE